MRKTYSILHSKNYPKNIYKKRQYNTKNIYINFYTHKIPHKISQLNFYPQKKP